MTERTWLYRLDGHEPVAEPDTFAWGDWFNKALPEERIVGNDRIGKTSVSTCFIGHDMNWSAANDPILFETAVFGRDYVNIISRYRTWDEAKAGHDKVVAELRGLPR